MAYIDIINPKIIKAILMDSPIAVQELVVFDRYPRPLQSVTLRMISLKKIHEFRWLGSREYALMAGRTYEGIFFKTQPLEFYEGKLNAKAEAKAIGGKNLAKPKAKNKKKDFWM
jgi:hypothetical protein